MISDDTESHLRDLLHRQAGLVQEEVITGAQVRAYADRGHRRGAIGWAPFVVAATIVAVVAGVAGFILAMSGGPSRTVPAAPVSTAPLTHPPTAGPGSGGVPRCPATTQAPGNPNKICAVGTAPPLHLRTIVIHTGGN